MKRNLWLLAVIAMLVAALACGGSDAGNSNDGGDGGNDNSPKATQATDNGNGGDENTAEPKATEATDGGDGGDGGDVQLPDPPAGGDFADAKDVEVTLGFWEVDKETNFLNVYGTVKNNSDAPITGQLALIYYDKDGKAISASVLDNEGSDSIVFTAPIAPGQTGFFFRPRDLEKLDNAEVADVKVQLWYAIKESKSPLGEFSNTETTEGDFPTYKGTVKNTGDATCVYPEVEVAYMDGDKMMYWASPIVDPEKLEPGEEMEFEGEISADSIKGDYTDVAFALTCSPTSFER